MVNNMFTIPVEFLKGLKNGEIGEGAHLCDFEYFVLVLER